MKPPPAQVARELAIAAQRNNEAQALRDFANYLLSLPADHPRKFFRWNGILLHAESPWGSPESVIQGTLTARTFREAACLVAGMCLQRPEENRFGDVFLSSGERTILAFSFQNVADVLSNPDLLDADNESNVHEHAQRGTAPGPGETAVTP